MDLPARLMPNSDEEAEDSSEEHQPQRPHDASQLNPSTMFVNMNQSIFGLIAAAGSTVDFTDRFEGQSSDSEDDDDEVGLPGPEAGIRGQLGAGGSLARTTLLRRPEGEQSSKSGSDKHRRKLSEHKLLRSLPALPRLGSRSRSKGQKKEKSGLDQQAEEESEPRGAASTQAASTSQGPSSSLTAAPQTVAAAGGQSQSIEVTRDEGRNLAPVMSRMLEARAEMQSRPSFDLERTSGEKARSTDEDDADLGPSPLAKKLMEIFQFEAPEEVIAGKSWI